MRQKNNGFPLPLDGFLSFNFWELLEASFILTEWPNNMVVRGIPGLLHRKFGRGALYFPDKIPNLKTLSKKTRTMLTSLKKAIEQGQLEAYSAFTGIPPMYGESLTYFLSSQEVIRWALLNGNNLPESVQRKLNINQQIEARNQKSLQNAVRNKFVGQMIHNIYPGLSVDSIRDHELMTKFGTKTVDGSRREISADLYEVFGVKGAKGTKTYINASLRPMPEVLIVDFEGNNRYSFKSLKTTLETATRMQIHIMGLNCISSMREDDFLKCIMMDDVALLYLKGASPTVLRLSAQICQAELEKLYSHHKISMIPTEKRKTLTIGNLRELQWEFCFEFLTPEEKAKHGIYKPNF